MGQLYYREEGDRVTFPLCTRIRFVRQLFRPSAHRLQTFCIDTAALTRALLPPPLSFDGRFARDYRVPLEELNFSGDQSGLLSENSDTMTNLDRGIVKFLRIEQKSSCFFFSHSCNRESSMDR